MINIIIYLILLATLHAKIELSIEGKKGGWGLRFPCWRISNWFINLIIGKELTAYHFYLMLMFLLLFHSPFLFINWVIKKELIAMGLYFWYWILEDYLWFVENDYYGIKNFKKGRIFWHRRWFLKCPTSYWISGIIGTILLILGGR
jgi:hypothetical protein